MLQFYAVQAFSPKPSAIEPAQKQGAKPDCLFAGRHKARFQKPQQMLCHGVLISCEDKEKRKVIRQAIAQATQAGFDLRGLRIIVSPKHDRELSPDVFGACTPEEKRIVL